MAHNLPIAHISMMVPDGPTFTKSRIPGTGTIITVSQNDDAAANHAYAHDLVHGNIDASQVTDERVRKTLLRPFVASHLRRTTPANGQRPAQIAVPMTARVAALAANIDSVRHTQLTFMTMGGVALQGEYMQGLNALQIIIGLIALNQLHQLLGSMHDFAVNANHAQTRVTAQTAMANCAAQLRDALCVQLGPPVAVQAQMNTLNATVANRDTTIIQLNDEIRHLHQLVQRSCGQGTARNNHDDNDDDNDNDDDDNNDQPGGNGRKRNNPFVSPPPKLKRPVG